MRELRTSSIDSAISALERAANVIDNTSRRYEYSREYRQIARDAAKELAAVNRELPRLLELKRNADRAYDAYVTREPDSCFCNADNAPCSWCESHCVESEEFLEDCNCELMT